MNGVVYKEGALWVVDAETYNERVGFTEEQQQAIVEGREATDRWVPDTPGYYKAYIVFRGDDPIGFLGVKPVGGDTVEVGVRLWERRAYNARLLGRFLSVVFAHYENVLAVVYHRNMMVKRLLQRAAFVLLGRERTARGTVETYGCRKGDFERVLGDDL